jgi:V/A-type H+-transporting ATPase subunit B
MRVDVAVSDAAIRIEGPLLFLRRTVNTGLNEAVEIEDGTGRHRLGRVVALDDDTVTIEVMESTTGLGLADTRVRFMGEPLHFAVGPDILGRVFDGVGQVADGGPPVSAVNSLRIDGYVINPAARAMPRDFIETGISSIDLMNSLVRGQKLPIFSGDGLPHDRLAVQIAHTTSVPSWSAAVHWSMRCCFSIWHPIPAPSGCSVRAML